MRTEDGHGHRYLIGVMIAITVAGLGGGLTMWRNDSNQERVISEHAVDIKEVRQEVQDLRESRIRFHGDINLINQNIEQILEEIKKK